MAETTLKTRIKLLYKTYAEWEAIKTTFYPYRGEVCITSIPQTSGPDIAMMKIGQWDGVDGSASKKSYGELPFVYANAADVYAWAKKENLDFADLDATFLAQLDARIAEKSENTEYQMVGNNGVWKLQKREIGGSTWTDVSTVDVAAYVNPLIAAEKARAEAEEAKKPDKEIVGTNGTAMLWNEASGGGAKFIHNDGLESFMGVNDSGKNGLSAQIYSDMLEDGVWVGSRINVYHNGIFYVSKVNQKAGFAKNAPEMEIATKKDIADLGQALHFVGIAEKQEGETELQAVERTFPAAQQKAGAVAICGNKEFICCGSPLAWREFGDVSAYATKAELQAEATTRAQEDTTLQANIDTEAATRATEDAKKVDKEIISAEGKALIFNEADGGGAKFEHVSGLNSFVGVNNGAEDEEGLAAQIYAVDATESGHNLGAKLDVTVGGMYYTRGAASGSRPSSRDVPANELAVKRDITEAVTAEATARQTADTTLQTNIDAEKARAQGVEATKADLPGECPPWLNPTGETPYPWFMASLDVESAGLGPDAEGNLKANVGAYNFNAKQYYKWEKNLPFAATQSKAGLMTAADKAKLDHFYAKDLTQETGDVLILDCNL